MKLRVRDYRSYVGDAVRTCIIKSYNDDTSVSRNDPKNNTTVVVSRNDIIRCCTFDGTITVNYEVNSRL